MCFVNFVEYSVQSPSEFRLKFSQIYGWYNLAAWTTVFFFRLGFILASGFASLQQILQTVIVNEKTHSLLGIIITVVLLMTGTIALIANICKFMTEKQIDELLGYTKYFLSKPNFINYGDGTFIMPTAINPTEKRQLEMDALKFRFHK